MLVTKLTTPPAPPSVEVTPRKSTYPETLPVAAPTVIVALLSVVVMSLFMFRTLRGLQAQVGGLAPAAASYAGFSARGNLWTVLLVSGGFAGLAGALEAAGPLGQLTPYVPAGYGFAAIIVAFVGRLHPVGIVFAAVLMSMLVIGGELAQSRMQLPKSVAGVFQGLLLFCLLAFDTLIHYRLRRTRKATGGELQP